MSSNDVGSFGIKQPVYFAMDNIKVRFPKSVEPPTANTAISQNTEVVNTEIFTIDGQKVESLQKGVNIIKTYFTDGSVKVSKRIVK